MFRTHTCGELNSEHVGQIVTLSGWIHKKRDLGELVFIDLRDRYGLTQITLNLEKSELKEIAHQLKNEFVIKITGTVQARPEQMVNKDMTTGSIEVIVSEVEILNSAKVPPFEISAVGKEEANEELRLKYRYLDLRRPHLQQNIIFRSKMVKFIRDFMDDRDFIHIDTPILTSSSPEGARDYLVPSRLHPGKFYALPQAPQQFKQLLMVSGFDKYYQIAPCMRDEDPRADRSPGEFYQLDVECSFRTSREFFTEMEPLFIDLTEKFANKKVKTKPFPLIPYDEAMAKYGSDKPDLRYDLEIQDITDWAQTTGFNVFKSSTFIKCLVVPGAETFSRQDIDGELAGVATKAGAKGLAWMKYVESKFDGGISKFFQPEELTKLTELLNLNSDCLLLFVADQKFKTVVQSLGKVRNLLAEKLNLIDPDLIAWAWIVDFPMYELNEETGKIDFCHNPFSMPIGGMEALENQDPLTIKADQYDIIANGLELSSGAVRNYRPEIMYKAFEVVGYGKEVVQQKFGAMIDAFSYGAPPHCGFAPGIERLAMVLLGKNNIRDVVAFPKNNQAQDLMMNAPSEITPEQLKELHLKIE